MYIIFKCEIYGVVISLPQMARRSRGRGWNDQLCESKGQRSRSHYDEVRL